LRECSEEFQNAFEQADLIVAKGQGNFETLRNTQENIFFMLKIKCDVVALQTGLPVGTQALIDAAHPLSEVDNGLCTLV